MITLIHEENKYNYRGEECGDNTASISDLVSDLFRDGDRDRRGIEDKIDIIRDNYANLLEELIRLGIFKAESLNNLIGYRSYRQGKVVDIKIE